MNPREILAVARATGRHLTPPEHDLVAVEIEAALATGMTYAVAADLAERLARYIRDTARDEPSHIQDRMFALLGWRVDWATGQVFDAEGREVNLDDI